MKSLTGEVCLKVGPVVLEVLVKHWFDCLKKDKADLGARLKGDDLTYHGMFVVAKEVLNAATSHTIEEMQSFANKRTPSPPWVHVVRTLVPLSCCDEAAMYLIRALGGEDVARQLVGGVKWWQVRAVKGVDAQWITMNKDRQKAKEMQQEQARPGIYDKNMDDRRCILYLHGGGYYFGSVDQTRYSSQRFARKINGRVFAIDYRLAPQYPFPCSLHDALAAYLFLIRPPLGSDHIAINPTHIIISGDSAGGALSLALLQVIRDSGLPLPAGGVLISPWCDLTHSFPSIYQNTENDFLPKSGLSFHKPSVLWPPPSSDISKRLHASLRIRTKRALRLDDFAPISQMPTIIPEQDVSRSVTFDSSSNSGPNSRDREKITMKMSTGEVEEMPGQLQFYTVNSLLNHPLVSPITGYLGGLPPLLFIAGDDEVLRDEIIYTAHKAAYPEKYPVHPSSHLSCSHLQEMEKRHEKPTSVHLQVYDGKGTHHILPVLFTFTTPAKFCFRAIANFDRFMTDTMAPVPMTTTRPGSCLGRPSNIPMSPLSPNGQSSFGQVPSAKVPQMAFKSWLGDVTFSPQESRDDPYRPHSEIVQKRIAGEPRVYEGIKDRFNWECRMIRERVSTSGIVRNLEPEDELAACKMPHERVAQISEFTVRRYLESKQKFDLRFGHTIEAIEKTRESNLAKAENETTKQLALLHQSNSRKHNKAGRGEDRGGGRPERNPRQGQLKFDQRVLSSPSWAWSWVLDDRENPPPSSIVGRRDTEEARKLAVVAGWAT